jgi:hypothetical protein
LRSKSYGWTAKLYSTVERLAFGSQLMRARLALLTHLLSAQHILILGEGDGRFLQALRRENPSATVVVVDRSRRMLNRAAGRLPPGCPNVNFMQKDAVEFLETCTTTFDAIVTMFLLDCLTPDEVAKVVHLGTLKLAPAGKWLWADFVVPGKGARRIAARVMLTLLYWFFRATTDTSGSTLVDAAPYFQSAGLRVVATAKALFGLVEARCLTQNPA